MERPGFTASTDDTDALSPEMDSAPPPAIGVDERRMHVRAYNFWANMLGSRSFPSIEDLDLDSLGDFGEHAVLLDFTEGLDNPAIGFVGPALARECDLEGEVANIDDVPRRSLLSRLTDHYLQIIANRAPIGFEAEFVNGEGRTVMYRGVLLPFSSDDDTIDFILGVINWKLAAEPALTQQIAEELSAAQEVAGSTERHDALANWADGPEAEHDGDMPEAGLIDEASLLERDDGEHIGDDELPLLLDSADQAEESLADQLAQARESADVAAQASQRGHRALYRAIAAAHAFALAIPADPETYAELLDEAGITPSPRKPLTAVAKLVFGAAHDKTRLAEIATVLRFAEREQLSPRDLEQRLAGHAGGLKALVRAERAASRPASAPIDRLAAVEAALRELSALCALPGDWGEEEFSILLTRREADGGHVVIGSMGAERTRQFLRQLNPAALR